MKKTKNKKFVHYLYIPADLLIGFIINLLSFLSYFSFNTFSTYWINFTVFSLIVSFILVVVLFFAGTYKILTRNFGISDALKTMVVVFVVELVSFCGIFLMPSYIELFTIRFIFPYFLSAIVLVLLIPALRAWHRIFALFNYYFKQKVQKTRIRTIVVGAGGAAKIVVDDSVSNKKSRNNIVALADDDPNKIGGTFSGIPVVGPISNLANFIDIYKIEEVIIAISDLEEQKLRTILDYLEPCDVRVRRMPLLSEMDSPNAKHIIDVDLNDLLCRDPIKLDNKEINIMLQDKIVLVTGAGGSIGSELVRQIIKTNPSLLILFDIYENGVYDIQQELNRFIKNNPSTKTQLVTLIGSTYNEKRMRQIFKQFKPNYVYHAAAYKHVPLMEDSPAEAIRTNVIGTYNVATLCSEFKVKKMVLVSTDKAVRPTNVMGATKRFAETIIQFFANKSKSTVYAAVRFGNVLGSNGSVVPLFKKQIEEGGPLTITHKDIIRYFMTIPEAVSLILQCSLFAEGGEIFILDMGKPVKIYNLALKMIRQAGFIPYRDIDIIETGLRPGEKLYEELLLDKKTQFKTRNNRIFIEKKDIIYPIEQEIVDISKAFDMEKNDDVKKLLATIVTSYKIDSR